MSDAGKASRPEAGEDSIYASGEYWQDNPGFHEEDSEFKFAEAGKLLEANRVSPRSILDCGCGGGLLSYLFVSRYGVETVGLDLAESSIERARARYAADSLSYRCGALEELDDHAFDLGLMFDVFEHVEDYLGFLRSARNKADRWLFNIPMDMTVASLLKGSYMRMRDSVGHLHYFSEKSALATLETAGFRVLDHAFANKVPHEFGKGLSVSKLVTGLPQLLLFKLHPGLSVRLLGGASLLVLAESTQA